MTQSTSRRTAVALGAALAGVALIGASPAVAAEVPLGGGSTTLTLDKGTAKALTSLGVKVAPTGRAKAGSKGVAFPITSGTIDPVTGAGTYKHSGGLRLSAGKIRLTLSDFNVVVKKNSTMSAKVNGGARLGALVPVIGKARVTRPGIDTSVSNVDIHLSSKGAAALNTTFKVKAFKPRLKLGTVRIQAKASEVAFTGGTTRLALDSGAAAALTSLGVTAGPAAPATADPDGSLAFPITEGRVKVSNLAGTIKHSGGITLTKGATSVTLSDFDIDTTKATLSASLGSARADILSLDLSAPALKVGRLQVTVGNVTAKLTRGAADALNTAFGTTAFTAGLTLGVATVNGETA